MNKILATISLAVVAAFSQQLSAKDYIITSHGVKNDSTKSRLQPYRKSSIRLKPMAVVV